MTMSGAPQTCALGGKAAHFQCVGSDHWHRRDRQLWHQRSGRTPLPKLVANKGALALTTTP